jgi:hypothetical protein
LLLLSVLLPFTWGRHRRARATTALPGASSLYTCSSMVAPTALQTEQTEAQLSTLTQSWRRRLLCTVDICSYFGFFSCVDGDDDDDDDDEETQ